MQSVIMIFSFAGGSPSGRNRIDLADMGRSVLRPYTEVRRLVRPFYRRTPPCLLPSIQRRALTKVAFSWR
jgi:hypothetical protein